jgi:hypothetical protein
MGLIDEKQDIFTQIGAYTSITKEANLSDSTNSLSSINNTNEIVPFLLDMLTVLVGSEALKSTVGEIMTTYIDSVEEDLKTSLKTQFSTFNSDQPLPSGFTGNGYTFKMSDIDIYSKTKTDPNTQVGSLLYNQNANDFDNKLYTSLVTPNTPVTFGVIDITYDDSIDTVNIKPNNPTQTIGEFTESYIDDLTIIKKNELTSNIINLLFGTITAATLKTLTTAMNEEKVNATLQKIINEEEDITLTDDELKKIQENAENKVKGLEYYDVGCGQLPNNVTVDTLTLLISGTTGSTDPLTVGNAYLNTLASGFNDAQPTGTTAVTDKATKNAATIKDNFFKQLINIIVNSLVTSVTVPPQIRALTGMYSGFKNNDVPELGDPVDDIKKNKNLVTCLSNNARGTLNKFIFDLVKKELIKIVIPVSKKILKEKINQYLGIIKSLAKFI